MRKENEPLFNRSAWLRGKWADPAYRQQQSASRKGVKKVFTDAHRANISVAQKARYAGKQMTRQAIERRRDLKCYGLDSDLYSRLQEEQRHSCGICGRTENGGREWSIDHDHKTGRVRGLLCITCNLLIGYASDDIALLGRAIEYLNRPVSGVLADSQVGNVSGRVKHKSSRRDRKRN